MAIIWNYETITFRIIAKIDLAERLNISISEIQLVKQQSVDWPDTSLSYPEEGKMYAQVITPGFRIILEAEGKLYEYRSDYERVVVPINHGYIVPRGDIVPSS
ncbi:MAG TPA: hypothetical protein VIO58_15615 [Candidatus Methanoperedens sp.]